MPVARRPLPPPKAVLFDLDGTLVDTVATRIDAWARVFEEESIPADRGHLARLIGVDGKRLAREVGAVAGIVVDGDRAEEIDRRCGEIYQGLNRDPRALPGVGDLVQALDARGVAWAIATSSRREQVATSVQALGLSSEPTIVDGSHVEHAKPEPDLLLLGARRLGVDPARCWYVGDSTWDVAAAIAAGMVPIGVTAGSAVGADVLEGSGAARVVDSLVDLVRELEAATA
jgi:HAD superfamily hydrolase (TIGR01509 family)